MPKNEVDIKIKTSVDGDELSKLNKDLKQLQGEESKIKVGADTSEAESATDKLREVQKKAKEIGAEKTLVNIDVATKALQEIEKIKSEYKELKNLVPPKFRVEMDNTAEGRIDEIRKKINDLDGLSPQIKAMIDSGAIDELQAIQTATDNLEGLSPKIKPTVDSDEAIGALDNIQNKMEGISGLESGITGVLGAFGAGALLNQGVETATNMDKAWRNWVGGLQEAGMGFDQAKKKADGFKKTVNNLAAVGQSNDSLFKNVAGLVINLNNKVSDSTLQMAEKVVAGYEMLGGRTGATMYEMEKELKNFLSTGELGLMQDTLSSLRDPDKWRGLLEGADTLDERISVLRDMLQEEGIMGALDIDAPSKSIDQLKALFDAGMTNIGTSLINMVKPIADGIMWLDTITNGLSTSVLSTTAVVGLLGVGFIGLAGAVGMVGKSFMSTLSGLKGFFSILKGGGWLLNALKGGGLVAQTSQLGANTAALTANTTALEANNLARAASMGGAAKGIKGIGAVGSAASGAAPGAAAGGGALSAISASITSMLIPLIAISAVIAIMIPIVAGLAIEVLLFVRLIGEVVKALAFDKLDLGSSIDGIKQIGLAMFEIGKAMAAITFVNIVGIVHAITGGVLTFFVSLAGFVAEVKAGVPIINELAKISDIDPKVANKIKQFNEACQQVVTAVQALSTIDSSLFNWNPFTNFIESIKTAKEDITESARIINNFKDIHNIDPAVANKLKAVTDSLKHMADSISALRTVDDKLQTWNPMSNLIEAMRSARTDIGNASIILMSYSTIANVPQGTADKIKTVATSLKNVSDSITSLRKIDDEQQTWNPMTNLITAMRSARTDIGTASVILAGYSTLANIPEGVANKIQRVQWTITHVVNALNSLNTVNNTLGKVDLSGIIGKLQTARTNIGFASVSLASYNTLANIDSSVITKIDGVKNTIVRVAQAVTALNGVPVPAENNNVALAVTQIKNAHSELQKLATLSGDGSGIMAAVTAVTNTINQIKSVLSAGAGVQAAAQNMGSKITTGFKIGAKNLGPASKTVVIAAITAVQNRYATMQSAGNALGAALVRGFKAGAGINSPMAAVISGMNDTISYIRGLTSDFYSAGSALGATLTAGMTDEEKEGLSASDLLRQNSGSVMDIYYGSGVNWMGGSAGSPFEEEGISSGSPSGNGDTYITLNSLVTEKKLFDWFFDEMERRNLLDNMRS